MKKILSILALAACAPTGAWAATYTYTGNPYSPASVHNHTGPGCPAGCGDFTQFMFQSGWFTTAAPLPAGLTGADIAPLITGFSFSDGLTTYSSAAGDSLNGAWASTAADGTFIDATLTSIHWHTPAPHVAGDYVDQMTLHYGVAHNFGCGQIDGTNPNVCASGQFGIWGSYIDSPPSTNGTWVVTGLPPAPAPAPQAVPVDNPFALALAALGVLGVALRRQRVTHKSIAARA